MCIRDRRSSDDPIYFESIVQASRPKLLVSAGYILCQKNRMEQATPLLIEAIKTGTLTQDALSFAIEQACTQLINASQWNTLYSLTPALIQADQLGLTTISIILSALVQQNQHLIAHRLISLLGQRGVTQKLSLIHI